MEPMIVKFNNKYYVTYERDAAGRFRDAMKNIIGDSDDCEVIGVLEEMILC